ncbi:MAG TPA: FGGY-family carbohydrate kinase [Actinomycetota bacterium]|nr:FGGY-family carbohydrate kinase [Actinomycetota bacterium]
MTRVLGIDIGVSGVRATVVDDRGTRLGTGRTRCSHAAIGGVAEHDARAWLDEAGASAREAVAEADVAGVDAIAVGALGPAPVLLDRDLEPLLPAPLFSLDRRAERHRQAHVATGVDVGPDHVRPRLLAWQETRPDALRRAAWTVDATGYVVGSLVGRPVMDRVTAGDHELVGSPPPVPMPEPEEPLALAGPLTEERADLLGVGAGTPVAVGTYDTFVDVAALPSGPGDVAILLGSTLIVGAAIDDPDVVVPGGLRSCPHVGSGIFVGGWTATAGSALEWSERTFGGSDPAATMSDAAALEPGGDGLLTFPALAGERGPVWDPLARGVVVGLTTSSDAAAIVRSVLDGVALSTLDLVERLRPLIPGEPRVWVAGGGVRNAAWLQATADALGVPVHAAPDLVDAGAAARFALRVVGVEPTPLRTVTIEPDLARHARYLELLSIHRGVYAATADVMHRLGAFAEREAEREGGR